MRRVPRALRRPSDPGGRELVSNQCDCLICVRSSSTSRRVSSVMDEESLVPVLDRVELDPFIEAALEHVGKEEESLAAVRFRLDQ